MPLWSVVLYYANLSNLVAVMSNYLSSCTYIGTMVQLRFLCIQTVSSFIPPSLGGIVTRGKRKNSRKTGKPALTGTSSFIHLSHLNATQALGVLYLSPFTAPKYLQYAHETFRLLVYTYNASFEITFRLKKSCCLAIVTGCLKLLYFFINR